MQKEPHKIIADSSFYLCFLDDINDPDFLHRIIEKFDLYITPIVECEIKIEKNKSLKENKKIIRIGNYIAFGEILKPFLSKKIIDKGEHEVIGLGFHFFMIGVPFYLVIDDEEARSFVRKNLSFLSSCLHGTVGLICLCCCYFKIFSKSETMVTFNKIENSKFRISKEILYKIKNAVESC
jgi:predicted nucleic acid-binding protein